MMSLEKATELQFVENVGKGAVVKVPCMLLLADISHDSAKLTTSLVYVGRGKVAITKMYKSIQSTPGNTKQRRINLYFENCF